MDMRDKARSDLYLAQLRTQSAPNTPGFGPKSPAFSQYALSPRFPPTTYKNLGDVEEGASPFTPGGKRLIIPESAFTPSQSGFKLQPAPHKANPATPQTPKGGFNSPSTETAPPAPKVNAPAPVADDEEQYEAVPIPGAYAGQAIKSPPPNQTTFGSRYS